MTDLSRCAQEESTIGEQIRAGVEGFGLRLGADDWIKEESILLLSRRGVTGQEQPEKGVKNA